MSHEIHLCDVCRSVVRWNVGIVHRSKYYCPPTIRNCFDVAKLQEDAQRRIEEERARLDAFAEGD